MKRFLALMVGVLLLLPVMPTLANAEMAYSESPVLAAKVQAGELPPVAERLPVKPQVLNVKDIGVYGGTWRQATPYGTYNHAHTHMTRYLSNNALIYDRDKKTIIPNFLESFSYNEGFTSFSFKLREGLKWSDGVPVTTEDVSFWWNDILKNTEFTPTEAFYTDATLTIADDYAFTIDFAAGKPMYLTYWATMDNSRFVYPAHYLKQFHPAYLSKEEMAETLKKAGYDDWRTMMNSKAFDEENPDLPVLGPWILTVDPAVTTTLTYARNPYYHVVDQNGQQLPYIDNCVITIVESSDVMNMKIVAGEVDYQAAGLAESFSNYPLFAQYAEEMKYKIWTTDHNEPGALNFAFNVASVDPVKGPILGNVEFRRALSLGMDRDAIIATFYTVGPFMSKKAQFSFLETSPYYNEEWTNSYINYDVADANARLDAMGLDKYDANGWRMTPDGQSFDITLLSPNFVAQWGEVAEMVAAQWRNNLKLNINVSIVEPALWGQRLGSNDFEITDLTGSGYNGFQTITNGSVGNWTAYADSCDWGNFCFIGAYVKGDRAGVASPEIKRLNELGKQIVSETNQAAKDAQIAEVISIWKEGLFMVGIGRRLPAMIIVKDYVRNITEEVHGAGWDFGVNGVVRADGIWFDAH